MFLLIADISKAIWFVVIPLVVFVGGPVSSSSPLCQGSGFFLAQAIEASDLGTLFFAIHAVSSVLQPPKRGSQAGLYPFRRWVNLLWVIVPIFAASLAFINSGNAYVSYGAFCYLPEQPVCIEQHLRVIFIYPTSYMLIWAFPFVSQCMQLMGRRFADQPRWLQILATGAIALQAGVDAAVFCYRERPWKRTRSWSVADFTPSRLWRTMP
ncbi:hypothetical protein DV737_g3892, partial [Chaetothyriales sp. CBS 132003]